MQPLKQSSVQAFAERYIRLASRSRYLILAAAAVLTGLTGWYSFTHLGINSDLAVLLPRDTPSVIALEESNTRFGSSDKFLIVVQSNDPQVVADFQDSLKADIDRDWSDVAVNTQIERDNSFFTKHALLYLPVKHLERIQDNLKTLQGRMGNRVNPLVSSLFEEEEDEEEEELVWFESSIPEELGLPEEAAGAFEGYYNGSEEESKKEEFDPKGDLPDHLKNRMIAKLKNHDAYNGVVLVKLNEPPTNLKFSIKVLERADALLEKYVSRHGGEVRMSVEGSYDGIKEVQSLKSDSLLSVYISLGLVFGLIIFFFRSMRAALLLVVQVLFATNLMLFVAALVYRDLNNYTLFVAAIIIGMGIDFSIHVLGSALRFHRESPSLENALARTVAHLMYPMFLAALTTVAGMLTLLIADFRGFYEFGVISAFGIAFSLVTAIFGLPVLVLVFGLPNKEQTTLFPKSWDDARTTRFIHRGTVAVLGAALVLLVFLPKAEFEHDWRNLRAVKDKSEKSRGPDFRYGPAMDSKRKSSQPAVVLGDSREELDKLYDTLMVVKNELKDPYLRSFLTLKTFVPERSEQEKRMEYVQEIRELIEARAFDKVGSRDSAMVERLRDMTRVRPFTVEDIPDWAVATLREKDGSLGSIGFIYGKYDSWDTREMTTFQEKFGNWNFGGRDLRVFSSAFITSDVVGVVKQDSLKMAVFISLVILLTLGVALRNRILLLISACSLGLGVILTVEFMGLVNAVLGVGKVGIFNVIVIPTVLGVGIDATIHLLVAFSHRGEAGLKRILDTTGKMVVASSLTTAGGFIGVLFISHRGMRTIGELAVIGILATLVAAFFLTPWLSMRFLRDKPPQA